MTLDGFENDTTARIVAVDWAALAEGEGKRLRALGVDEGAEVSVDPSRRLRHARSAGAAHRPDDHRTAPRTCPLAIEVEPA